ncbi:ABC transporter permease [Nocardia sp. NPDC051570]|uniref:ABC transporter permease n=1 Tax=Nocardia sp. NPDC051570 TaxID=3364324 RepID=UPI00379A100E
MLTVIVIAVAVLSFVTGKVNHPAPAAVGLVASAQDLAQPLTETGAASHTPIHPTPLPDIETARTQVRAGTLAVALVPDGRSYTAISRSGLDNDLAQVVDTAVRTQATNHALQQHSVNPTEVATQVAATSVHPIALDPPDPHRGERIGMAYATMLVLYGALLLFGVLVAQGVVEEKASRIVEILLATIKPAHLLWGKILGIGALGLLQTALLGVVAVGSGIGFGVLTLPGTAIAVLVSGLGWFVLGYLFFAVAYAAAGSLVSRQEEVTAATMPLTLLAVAMLVLAQFVVAQPDSATAAVASWIPPFSAILMPIRIAAGGVDVLQILGTIAIMLVFCLAIAMVAARVYQRSVLHVGTRMSWRMALLQPRRG